MDVRQGRSEDSQSRERRNRATRFRALRHVGFRVEGLETRELLSGVIADVGTISPTSGAVGSIVPSSDGQVWFAQGSSSVSKLASNGTKVVVNLPSGNASQISDLVVDASGNSWYGRGNMVGKIAISGSSGTATEFSLSHATDKAGAETVGPDGNIWVAVTTTSGMALAKVDASGNVTEVPLSGVSQVKDLTTGPDGNLWFVDGQTIAKSTTTGQVTHYNLTSPTAGAAVDLSNAQLVAGAGDKLWFIGLGGISSITTSGAVHTYPTPSTSVTSLAFAPDGNLWFSFLPNSVTNSTLSSTPGAIVGRMTQVGQITLVNDRANGNGAAVSAIVATNDGHLWLNEGGAGLAQLSTSVLPAASNPIIRPTTAGYVATDQSGLYNGPLVSFAPNAPAGNSETYTAAIDWGDGLGSVGNVLKNNAGSFTVYGLHTYNFPVNTLKGVIVTITDSSGNTAKIFNTVLIKSTIAPVSASNSTSTSKPGTQPASTSTTSSTTPSTTGASTSPGTPLTAGSVKSAIMQVLQTGGTNAQAIAAGQQVALQLRANRLAGSSTPTSGTASSPTSTSLTGTATPAGTTTPGSHHARRGIHQVGSGAHPRGPAHRLGAGAHRHKA